jgi:hypothetical protein
MPTTTPVAKEMIATKASVSASLAQENLRRKDMRVGIMAFAGIALVLFVIAKLSGC